MIRLRNDSRYHDHDHEQQQQSIMNRRLPMLIHVTVILFFSWTTTTTTTVPIVWLDTTTTTTNNNNNNLLTYYNIVVVSAFDQFRLFPSRHNPSLSVIPMYQQQQHQPFHRIPKLLLYHARTPTTTDRHPYRMGQDTHSFSSDSCKNYYYYHHHHHHHRCFVTVRFLYRPNTIGETNNDYDKDNDDGSFRIQPPVVRIVPLPNNNNNDTTLTIPVNKNPTAAAAADVVTTSMNPVINNQQHPKLPISVTSSLGDIMSVSPSSSSSSTRTTPLDKNSTSNYNDMNRHTVQIANTTTATTTTTSSPSSLQDTYRIYHPLDRMILTANGNVQRLISSYYDTHQVQVNVIHCQVRTNHISTSTTTTNPTTGDDDTSELSSIIEKDLTQQPQIWDRQVELCLYENSSHSNNNNNSNNDNNQHSYGKHIFCIATSIITIYDRSCQELIQSQQIGIGQLFRYYNILPNFTLHDAGPLSDNNENEKPNRLADGGGNFWREYTLSCPQLSCHIREEFLPGLWNISTIQR